MTQETVYEITHRLQGLELQIEVLQHDDRPVILLRLPLPSPAGPAPARPPGEPESAAFEAPTTVEGELADPLDYTFEDIPAEVAGRRSALRTRPGRAPPTDRILRAWQAGKSALQILQGTRRFEVALPAASLPPVTVYIVLRAKAGLALPGPVRTPVREHYLELVTVGGVFEAGTVSRGFASGAEAKVYCAAAGFGLVLPPLWQPARLR